MTAYKTKTARLACALTVALVAALACPAYAFASEEEEGGINAILPSMNEFIPMLVAFIILWIVLAKFGWPLFDGMLEKRSNTIRDDLKHAEEARQESERVLAEYRQELAEAKTQASKIIAEAKQTGEDVKAEITAKAQQEAADMIEKARVAIEADKKAARAELQASVADVAVAVTARLVGNDVSDEEHRRLIKRYVEEAGSFDAN